MAHSFLTDIKKHFGSGGYAGDEFGGAGGTVGRGLPSGNAGNFMFATGIECSYPTIDNGKTRRDLLDECGHYSTGKEDLELVKELGLKVLRYGLPYYKIQLGPDKYDWEFADLVMDEMQRLDITPILDLMHFGVPDLHGQFPEPRAAGALCATTARKWPSATPGCATTRR